MTARITRTAVMRPRQCTTCGETFFSRSSKKIYCDRCARERERKADRERAHRKARAARIRELGKLYPCKRCGAPFVLEWGTMKHCSPCRESRLRWWKADRAQADPAFDINDRIRRRINESLGRGRKGRRSWEALVGYNTEELMAHLERQFLPRMTWENRSKWHIDHIVPLSSFHFTGPDDPEFRAAWSLTNLRPIWAADNLRKRSKRLFLL